MKIYSDVEPPKDAFKVTLEDAGHFVRIKVNGVEVAQISQYQSADELPSLYITDTASKMLAQVRNYNTKLKVVIGG